MNSQRTCLTPHLLLQLCVVVSHGEKHHFGNAIRTQEQQTLLSLSATQERFTCCNVFKLLHICDNPLRSRKDGLTRVTVTVKSTFTVTRFDSAHSQGRAHISKGHTALQGVNSKWLCKAAEYGTIHIQLCF